MFSILHKLYGSLPVLILSCLLVFTTTTEAEIISDPMQPPAFALEKFRLAKLKKNGVPPVKSSEAKKVVPISLQLNSILIGKKRKIAIINDQMLVVGDKIGSARLLRILKNRVQLSRSGRKIELKLENNVSVIRKQVVESKL